MPGGYSSGYSSGYGPLSGGGGGAGGAGGGRSMPLYKPPTGVTTVQIPYQSLVQQSDPAWIVDKYREVEYVFSRRAFYGNPYQRGPYAAPNLADFSPQDFSPADFNV